MVDMPARFPQWSYDVSSAVHIGKRERQRRFTTEQKKGKMAEGPCLSKDAELSRNFEEAGDPMVRDGRVMSTRVRARSIVQTQSSLHDAGHRHYALLFILHLLASASTSAEGLEAQAATVCLPFQDSTSYQYYEAGAALLLLDDGSCSSASSTSSTPCLIIPPTTAGARGSGSTHPSNFTTTTWMPSPTSAQQPVLDLCNQVQSIWLMPGG